MESFSAIAFLGALAIFMYGIRISRIGVQLLAGDRLRKLITALTRNRFTALGVGVVSTLILQSSTATTSMLVGFASSGVITLPQAMGVILGADIGTTFVVMLLSIRKIADYALLFLVGGVALDIIAQRKQSRYMSMVLLGFGFVFFGLRLMIDTTTPLRDNALLEQIFSVFGQYPGYAFLAAVLFTALVQNSATTLGLAMACGFSGLLDLKQAIPIVLGANVGTCAGSFLSSLGTGAAGRRVALSHLLFKLTGASIALILLSPLTSFIVTLCSSLPLFGSIAPQIALTHVGFNLSLSLLFLPFITQGATLLTRWFPDPEPQEGTVFVPKYLDPKSLETPALAFANAKRELLRMADIGQEMFRKTIDVFTKNDTHLIASLEEQDDQLDLLDREIKFYLAKLSQEALTPDQGRLELNLVTMTASLEEIGDILNKNILELAAKKIQTGREFSEDGWKEISDFHTKIFENFALTIAAITSEDEVIARKVLRHEHHLGDLEDLYRKRHIERLHRGLKEAFETSSIHLDLLSNLRRINSKLTAMVKPMVRSGEGPN